MTTYDAYVELLSTPDLACLPHRGFRVTYSGDPKRRQTVFLPLMTRWAQNRYLDMDPAPFIAPAKLGARLRVIRRAHA